MTCGWRPPQWSVRAGRHPLKAEPAALGRIQQPLGGHQIGLSAVIAVPLLEHLIRSGRTVVARSSPPNRTYSRLLLPPATSPCLRSRDRSTPYSRSSPDLFVPGARAHKSTVGLWGGRGGVGGNGRRVGNGLGLVGGGQDVCQVVEGLGLGW